MLILTQLLKRFQLSNSIVIHLTSTLNLVRVKYQGIHHHKMN